MDDNKLLIGLAIVGVIVVLYWWFSEESFEESAPGPAEPPTVESASTAAIANDTNIISKLQSQFADEDNPIAGYTNYLQKTGKFNPHQGGNFFMENEEKNLYRKQGVISSEEEQKQRAYVQGQYGKWATSSLDADDRRNTTSPYVGTTRSLRAVKIRRGDTIVPDKISDTFRPIM